MKLIFNDKMFNHINEAALADRGQASRPLIIAEKLLRVRVIVLLLGTFEWLTSQLLNLPIPIYNSLVYVSVTNARGLPFLLGNYLRALYYRPRLGGMEPNVFIDQGVFFAYPRGVYLSEFSFIDKHVLIMSRTAHVGRRVHIAANTFISGGGDFVIDDYACIATNSNIITSSEIPKGGARCSGPMASAHQRNVRRGIVRIEKDAFVGANVTILPNVTIKEGSVAGAGVTITRDTVEWGVYVSPAAQNISGREPVTHLDN